MKKNSIILLALASSICQADPIGIGFIESIPSEESSEATLYSSQVINSHSTIDLEYRSKSGNIACCQRIPGNLFRKTQSTERVSNIKNKANIHTYTILRKNLSPGNLPEAINIVIINANSTKEVTPDIITARAGSDEYEIERCYGIEGINLYKKKSGKTLEHLYLYLNYDIEPTCH